MISPGDATLTQIDKGTPGGDTYYVILPNKTDPTPLCFRKIKHRDGAKRCTNVAGLRTWHPGTGACFIHGGGSRENGPRLANGKQSKMRGRLQVRVDNYLSMDRARLLDLSGELAISRSLFDDFVDVYKGPEDEQFGAWFYRFNQIVTTLGTLVEKISRIDTRNTLTAAQVLYLQATVADILMKYINDPDLRNRAARELASRMGGEHSVELQPSEYNATVIDQ